MTSKEKNWWWWGISTYCVGNIHNLYPKLSLSLLYTLTIHSKSLSSVAIHSWNHCHKQSCLHNQQYCLCLVHRIYMYCLHYVVWLCPLCSFHHCLTFITLIHSNPRKQMVEVLYLHPYSVTGEGGFDHKRVTTAIKIFCSVADIVRPKMQKSRSVLQLFSAVLVYLQNGP